MESQQTSNEPIASAELLAALEKYDRQMRRDSRAMFIRQYRYLTRTSIEQMRADSAEYNRRVIERGWIVGESGEGR